jgi:protein-tyrosine phosphatase
MIKVLFVCLGNICRSPLAEVIFNHKIQKMGLENQFKSDSAGTSDFHIGELPDDRSIKCAKKNGLLMTHRARQVNRTDFRDFHYIIAMDENNLRILNNLKDRYKFSEKEIFLMRDFGSSEQGQAVPDPYYGGEEGFDEIFQILDQAIDDFLVKIKEVHQIYA